MAAAAPSPIQNEPKILPPQPKKKKKNSKNIGKKEKKRKRKAKGEMRCKRWYSHIDGGG